jgi:hypothetical protein
MMAGKYSTEGGLDLKQEETRAYISKAVIWLSLMSLMAIFAIGGIFKFDIKDTLTFFLATTTFWAGLWGAIVTYYFVAKKIDCIFLAY